MTQTDIKNVPKLRFPEFEGAWESKTLGDFFTFKNGVNAEKSAYGTGRKFINVLDIVSGGSIFHDKIIGCVEIADSDFQKNEVVYGDILFQRSSETREEVGQSSVYLDKDKSATFGGFVIRGRPLQEINPKFFDMLLKTDAVRKDMTSRSGGSTRYNVGQESLSEVRIAISANADEQKKITSFLSAVDDKIQQLEKRKALLQDYRKGCMQQIFSQEIRFKDDDGNEFPKWKDERLGNILQYEQPTKYLVNNVDYRDNYSTPVLTAGKTFILGYSNENNGIYNNPLPVIIFDDFTTAFKFVDFPFKAKSSAMKILKIVNDTDDIRFFFAAMCQIRFQVGEHKRHWIGEYQELAVPYPHPDEQRKIADFLSAIDGKIELASQKLAQAKAFKRGLLQQMFV